MSEFVLATGHCDFTGQLSIKKRSSWEITFQILQAEDGVETPFDLTGYTGECEIRSSATSSTIVAQPTVSITASTGVVKLSLTASQTANITTSGEQFYQPSIYSYDVLLTKDTSVYRVLEGIVEVSPGITVPGDEV